MPTLAFNENLSEDDLNEDQIIKNFGKLIKQSEKARTNQNLRSVISKLEENIKDNEKYIVKMFLLNTKNGSMINSDNAPNISFRVDTINNIFNSISDSIKNLGIPQEKINEIFFNAGKNCGESFGQTFSIFLDTYMEGLNLEEKIEEWCLFDSSVGWGKLTFDSNNKQISIINNFQTKKNDQTMKTPIDCNFFKGYICGVLSKLIGGNLNLHLSCEQKDECPKITGLRDCKININY